jgi:hypothetical protein
MKKRILLLLTVVVLMVATMVVMAAPAFARVNCEGLTPDADYLFCRGGEGTQGGGFANFRYVDYTQPGYPSVFFLGGGGGGDGSGGGGGVRCTGLLLDPSTLVCHGGVSS